MTSKRDLNWFRDISLQMSMLYNAKFTMCKTNVDFNLDIKARRLKLSFDILLKF